MGMNSQGVSGTGNESPEASSTYLDKRVISQSTLTTMLIPSLHILLFAPFLTTLQLNTLVHLQSESLSCFPAPVFQVSSSGFFLGNFSQIQACQEGPFVSRPQGSSRCCYYVRHLPQSLSTASWQVGLCPLCPVTKRVELLLQLGKPIQGASSTLLVLPLSSYSGWQLHSEISATASAL